MTWFTDLIRTLFGTLDSIIYNFVNYEYITFINISQLTILNNESFNTFAERIYALVGVFMLFKLAFSLLAMLVNPDSTKDSNKGVGKIIQRVLISLVLLVMVPTFFEYAYKIQTIVLQQNILANIILGGDYNDDNGETKTREELLEERQAALENGGKQMGFAVLNAFLTPKYKELAFPESEKEQAKEILGQELYDSAYTPYLQVRKDLDVDGLLELKNIKDEDGEYVFSYNYFISTIAGFFVAWVMLMFCLEVGVRMVKLTFLQLIAPVPVLSYIEPKTGKILNSWAKECVKTYLDVFVRLLIIYFVIFILSIVIEDGIFTVYRYEMDADASTISMSSYNPSFIETALIVIGFLLFAKEAPRLISDILGIKMKSDFTLNPFSKLQSVPGLGWAGSQLYGRAAGAITAARNDHTGMPVASFFQGWNKAGSALRGKVSFMGNKPNQAPVHSRQIGRDAAYELVGGDKDKVYSPMANLNKGKAEQLIKDLKDNKKSIQSKINDFDLELSAYQRQYQEAMSKGDKKAAQVAYANYTNINKQKFTAQKHLGNIEDQIKDIKKRYHIDDSDKDAIKNAVAYAKTGGSVDETESKTINKKTEDSSFSHLNSEQQQYVKDQMDNVSKKVNEYNKKNDINNQ